MIGDHDAFNVEAFIAILARCKFNLRLAKAPPPYNTPVYLVRHPVNPLRSPVYLNLPCRRSKKYF